MQELNTFYPVRIISRSVSRKRFRRASWFVAGTGFGMVCALSLAAPQNYLDRFSDIFTASKPQIETAAQISTTKGIDIVALALPPKPAKSALKPHAVQAYPLSLAMKVEDGDTLLNLLTDAGAPYEEAQGVVDALRSVYNAKKLDIGQNIDVVLDKPTEGSADPIISSVKMPASTTATLEITHKSGQTHDFAVKKIIEPVERRLARAGGRIDSSLYETATASGMPAGLLNDIITAYSYDVDFQRDVQPGDTLDVLYERLETKQGANAGHGNLLYAELNLSGENMRIYRYVDKSGTADYYNEHGESVRKAMLRTPINGARITSGYGMRNHPILGYSKMHRGIDFGAPTGTPIYAAGDGTVDFAGRKGGYGNYLRIKHNEKYSSAYGHISRFASNVAPGRKVRQGQIVAYVGATGMATGPHLHYEILVDNEQVNPSSVKFRAGNVLAGKEMTAFRKNIEQIEAQRNNTPRKVDVASAHDNKELVVAQASAE